VIHELKLDKKELRFLREAVEREQERLLAEQKRTDEESDAYRQNRQSAAQAPQGLSLSCVRQIQAIHLSKK